MTQNPDRALPKQWQAQGRKQGRDRSPGLWAAAFDRWAVLVSEQQLEVSRQ